jgi:endonuclease/exonuclease/phosphatase family metal-dependent hydrolase
MKMRNLTSRKTGGVARAALSLLLALVLAGCTSGCDFSPAEETAEKEKIRSLTIMTWNLQAMFDGNDDGTEYAEYRMTAGWSAEKYKGRLNVIASAIGGMENVPDVIAVQEVESAIVIYDLAGLLAKHGYNWTHFANNPGMALGVGILSRFPLEGTRAHSISVNGDTAPRPVLETKVNAGDGELALFVCHWKSKLGSADATEAGRRASARVILRRMRELAETEPELPVIIMGDLNENHDEFYRRGGSVISALLPDDPRTAEQTAGAPQADYLIISKSKPPVTRHFKPGALALYSPWNKELKDGSYYYKNEWETIDHFLLSEQLFNQQGWDFSGASVANYPPFANPNGYPMTYNPRTGAGLSDHLPLLLSLQFTP